MLPTIASFHLSTRITVTVSHDNRRAYVALWNGSAIAALDLESGKESGKVLQTLTLLPPDMATSPSSHPTALAFSRDEKTLYVALANRDAVAAVHLNGERMQPGGIFNTQLPGQHYFGAMPDAVALSPDGQTLYAANSGSDAVAVFSIRDLKAGATVAPKGFIPTEWYPTALAIKGNQLFIATAKGKGTGPTMRSRSRNQTIHQPNQNGCIARTLTSERCCMALLRRSTSVPPSANCRSSPPKLWRAT